MRRVNTFNHVMQTGVATLDVGDGIQLPIRVDGIYPGEAGPPGAGVPAGGATGQIIRKTAGGSSEWFTPSKSTVGLPNVDNTADVDKPVSEAQAEALALKADKTEVATPFTYNGSTVRLDQQSSTTKSDALKIINASAASYALKVDQTGASHDAVNIASLSGGGHTALGVLASNTSLSTTKITNNGAQVGGAVVAALGTDPARTAGIFNGENSGSGGTYISTMQPTGTGPAFQATYDPATMYGTRALWVRANHTAGDLVYVENAQAQTAGSSVKIVQSNAGTTAPIVSIANAGTGDHITANNFAVTQTGNVKAASIYNFASFNNARVQLAAIGTTIDRNVADTNPALKVNNLNAFSTGDLVQFQKASAVKARITTDGHIAVRTNTAPTDATLIAGELAFWFDSTNGASKLMVKGKQADGTIKTGSVALA